MLSTEPDKGAVAAVMTEADIHGSSFAADVNNRRAGPALPRTTAHVDFSGRNTPGTPQVKTKHFPDRIRLGAIRKTVLIQTKDFGMHGLHCRAVITAAEGMHIIGLILNDYCHVIDRRFHTARPQG